MRLQEKKGFAFDIEKAEKLELSWLASKRAELLDRLQKEFPAKTEEMKSPAGWSLQVECTERYRGADPSYDKGRVEGNAEDS